MVKLLSLLLLATAVIAIPTDDWKDEWKNQKCPAPVTVTKIEYKEVPKEVVKYQTKEVTKTEYKKEYVTTTEYKKEYVTAAPVVKYQTVYKECEKKGGWGDN